MGLGSVGQKTIDTGLSVTSIAFGAALPTYLPCHYPNFPPALASRACGSHTSCEPRVRSPTDPQKDDSSVVTVSASSAFETPSLGLGLIFGLENHGRVISYFEVCSSITTHTYICREVAVKLFTYDERFLKRIRVSCRFDTSHAISQQLR